MANQIKAIPKREPLEFKYQDKKDRKMVSIRLPQALIERIKSASDDTGYSFTDLVQYALDQFAQIQDKHSK
jgi:predicted DNA binding CopG/RHH family protein